MTTPANNSIDHELSDQELIKYVIEIEKQWLEDAEKNIEKLCNADEDLVAEAFNEIQRGWSMQDGHMVPVDQTSGGMYWRIKNGFIDL